MMEFLSKYNWISVGVFILIIIVAHIFVSPPYNWKNNTISELASQHYNYRWIMKIGFILFGGILIIGIIGKLIQHKGNLITEIPILIYGLAILISGIYSTKPIMEGVEFSITESQIHSICAQTAGIAFSIGLLIFGFRETVLNLKLIHFGFFIFVIGCSALFGLTNSNVGIIQRVMYLGSFIWLTFFYNQNNVNV